MLGIRIFFVAVMVMKVGTGVAEEPKKTDQNLPLWKQKRPEFKSAVEAMEYFRKDSDLVGKEVHDMNLNQGLGITAEDGAILHLNKTVYLANKVPIRDIKDLMILMAYVNEQDLELRGFAIFALEHSLKAHPDAPQLPAAVTDLASKQHIQLVERFAEKLAHRAGKN